MLLLFLQFWNTVVLARKCFFVFLRLCFHFGDKIFSVRLFLAHSNLKIMSKFSTIYRTKSSFLGSSLEFNMYRWNSILEELMIRNLIKKKHFKNVQWKWNEIVFHCWTKMSAGTVFYSFSKFEIETQNVVNVTNTRLKVCNRSVKWNGNVQEKHNSHVSH